MADDGTAFLHKAMPLCATLGIRAVSLDPAAVVLELDWAEDRLTSGGLLHGGTVMALADAAGGYCAFANLPEGASGTGDDRVEDEHVARRGVRHDPRNLDGAARGVDDARGRDRDARRGRSPRREDDADPGGPPPLTGHPLLCRRHGRPSAGERGMIGSPPGWNRDPYGRHEVRYYDGTSWTEHVSDQGIQGMDPPVGTPLPPPSSFAPDPSYAPAPTFPPPGMSSLPASGLVPGMRYRSIHGLAVALTWLLGVAAVAALPMSGAFLYRRSLLERIRDGDFVSLDDARSADDYVDVAVGLGFVIGLAVFVVLVVFLFRDVEEHRAVAAGTPSLDQRLDDRGLVHPLRQPGDPVPRGARHLEAHS